MKIENKKTVILTVIGILMLLISIIGATYAYFTVDTKNEFKTPKIDASTSSIGTVSLNSIENNLYLNLSRSDMMSNNTGVYYAVSEENGVASKEENEVEIGYTQVVGTNTYTCNYTLNLEYTGDMKEKLTKGGVLILNINGIDYDIYSIEFPKEITGTFKNISSSKVGKITASLRFNNLNEEQSELINKNVKLEISAKEFNCTAVEDNSVYAKVVSDYENGNGVLKLSDSDKGNRDYDTYYYTGDVTNNNVLYGGFCWKMVITTEGEGVKMIYNGVPTDGSCDNTGDASTIGTSAFNSSYKSPAYVGYMYNKVYTVTSKSMSSDTTEYVYGNTFTYSNGTYTLSNTTSSSSWNSIYSSGLNNYHYTCFNTSGTCTSLYYIYYTTSSYARYITLTDGKSVEDALNEMLYAEDVNTTNSTIKTKIDSWYESNLLSTKDSNGNLYSSYLQNTIYCDNRATTSLGAFNPDGGSNDSYMIFNYSTLDCENKTDQFTLKVSAGGEEGYGNNALTYPIGLLNYKEVSLARNESNTNYLSNSLYFRILTPYYFTGSYPYGWIVYNGSLHGTSIDSESGVRPVVTLSSSVKIKNGDGSVTSPYIMGLS